MDWHSRRISAILEHALLEDHATSDATSRACIEPQQRATATITAKQDCVIAGVGAISRILELYERLDQHVIGHPEVISHGEIFDGVRLRKGQVIAVVRHNARVLLSCERVMLNVLQRLSGIATMTRKFVDAIQGTQTRILDTRKTAPGLRVLDKYAVRCGGGHNHRLDLSDGVLIKNNHIALAGGVGAALQRVHQNRGDLPIEVEVRNWAELQEALANGAERIMLDNMTVDEARAAVEHIRKQAPKVTVEASGGIRLENVRAYAETGVDYISVGALTHSPQAVDLSMKIIPA
jgi:nicotinate-nucleotide pyrophosphorylase (carboxylating)